MNHALQPIIFTLVLDGEEIPVQTHHGAYRDLRALINDRCYIEDFGQCGGLGRCGTCLVEIREASHRLRELSRNEATTLRRTAPEQGEARLSCQILINDDLANTVIHVLAYVY